jgi:hypothetical protein
MSNKDYDINKIIFIQRTYKSFKFFKIINEFMKSIISPQSSFSSFNPKLVKNFNSKKINDNLFIQNEHLNSNDVKILIIGCGISISYDCYPRNKKCHLENIYKIEHNDKKVLTIDMDPYVSPHLLSYINPVDSRIIEYLLENFPNIKNIIYDGIIIPNTYDMFSKITKNIFIFDGSLKHIIEQDTFGMFIYSKSVISFNLSDYDIKF